MFGAELKSCIRVTYQKDYFNGNHTHPYYELVYYYKGNGKVSILDKPYAFSSGTYSVSRPETYHCEEGVKGTDLIYISFTINNTELENGIYDDDGTIGKLMFECYKELQEKKPMFQLILNNLTEQIIIQYMRANLRPKNQPEDSFTYIMNYIDINATQNLSVKEIAKNIGYNYNYFRELFFEKRGVSLKDYLIEKKISFAEKLLKSTDYNLSKIASMSGFSSASHLCSLFKKQTGITPQEYNTTVQESYKAEEKYLPPEFNKNVKN
ncbi:MAG: AraC family transcriptional regulator [Candidatus Borkfalkiaceae bacterium]|nr:AraC family transcriptional regulator [Christensenellaceae bacterium]